MSYLYLRYSRLQSQRVPPDPIPGSIDALLSRDNLSNELLKLQILNNDPKGVAVDYEPLPFLDYHLLYTLISLARPYLDGRDIKRFDYLIQARRWYFTGHVKSQAAFIELQSASAYEEILAARSDKVAQALQQGRSSSANDACPTPDCKQQLDKSERELADIETARRKNNEDLRRLLLVVENRAKARDHATTWLSSLKWKFLQTEVPTLVNIAKQIHAQRMAKQGMMRNPSPHSFRVICSSTFVSPSCPKPG